MGAKWSYSAIGNTNGGFLLPAKGKGEEEGERDLKMEEVSTEEMPAPPSMQPSSPVRSNVVALFRRVRGRPKAFVWMLKDNSAIPTTYDKQWWCGFFLKKNRMSSRLCRQTSEATDYLSASAVGRRTRGSNTRSIPLLCEGGRTVGGF